MKEFLNILLEINISRRISTIPGVDEIDLGINGIINN
jgi:hypothetical protein